MNKHKLTIRIILGLMASILVGVFIGVGVEKTLLSKSYEQLRQGDKLTYTMSLLETIYVDSISRDSIMEMVVPELLRKLDPHSSYIPREELEAVNEPIRGQFDGIGVMFNMITDTALITNVIAGGPSSKSGVVAGDRIITVNDSIVAGIKMDSNNLVKKLRGKRGTDVRLGIQRSSKSPELTQITITRDVIPVKSLEAAFRIKEDIGYIKFGSFATTTYGEFTTALDQLKSEGVKSLIIDLRGNGGGLLDQAIYIANEFLKAGNMIVYTEGAHSLRSEARADGRGRFQDMPLVVLVDETSASASEILAGAIQDNDRGMIVGRRSFGKGLVQEQIDYKDGSAARITVAHYYTPLGRSIQKPYKAGQSEEYFMELYRRAAHHELFNVDSIKQNEALKYITPIGRVVYGGGGIMPDYFVPMDTTNITPYFRKLFDKNLIFTYASKLTEENRPIINSISSFEQMDNFFALRNIYYDFVIWADRQGVPMVSSEEMNKNKSLITAQIKGYIARNTPLQESAFFYYIYPEDSTMTEAIARLGK